RDATCARRLSAGSPACSLASVKLRGSCVCGAELVRRYDVEGTRWSSVFCPSCGSALPFSQRPGNVLRADSSSGGAFVVPAGSLQGELTARPRLNIFFGSRAPWYTHASELETLDTIPQKISG
ncbi:MAG TPA: hypothetical protein VG963_21995, partial [Polyangiaceae bacterium]|nr:hypothetical protein [Polyangiaceae bacterium]